MLNTIIYFPTGVAGVAALLFIVYGLKSIL